jgi:hypothetical protein
LNGFIQFVDLSANFKKIKLNKIKIKKNKNELADEKRDAPVFLAHPKKKKQRCSCMFGSPWSMASECLAQQFHT